MNVNSYVFVVGCIACIPYLVRTKLGDEDIDVVFNTDSEEFTRSNAATKKDHHWVSVSYAWDVEWFRAYRKKLSDSPTNKRTEDRLEKLPSSAQGI